MCQCHHCCGPERAEPARSRFRPLSLLFNLALAWLVLVVTGGTLIRSGHPVAVETGRIIQTVTFVEPAIRWVDGRGIESLAAGLKMAAAGLPIERVLDPGRAHPGA